MPGSKFLAYRSGKSVTDVWKLILSIEYGLF